MKNIPVFTGINGTASLVLQEIPWSGSAYVMVRSIWTNAASFLAECKSFCIACGAQRVYACFGTETLPCEPAYDMIQLEREKAGLPKPGRMLVLEPLSKDNLKAYTAIYDTCFRDLPGAAACRHVADLVGKNRAFIAEDCAIAEISDTGLEAIGTVRPGMGYDLALTVLSTVPSDILKLKTASTNLRALKLYKRLGFVQTAVTEKWWKL